MVAGKLPTGSFFRKTLTRKNDQVGCPKSMGLLIDLIREYRSATTLERKCQVAERITCAVRPAMWAQAFHRGNSEMADDVCQETLVAIFKDLPRFYGETDNEFWKWCHSLVRHKIIDRIRKKASHPTVSLETENLWQTIEAATSEEPLSPGARMDLDYAMKLLARAKPPCVDHLWAYYVEEVDLAEIAKQMQLSYDAARMQINRCLQLAQSLVR